MKNFRVNMFMEPKSNRYLWQALLNRATGQAMNAIGLRLGQNMSR